MQGNGGKTACLSDAINSLVSKRKYSVVEASQFPVLSIMRACLETNCDGSERMESFGLPTMESATGVSALGACRREECMDHISALMYSWNSSSPTSTDIDNLKNVDISEYETHHNSSSASPCFGPWQCHCLGDTTLTTFPPVHGYRPQKKEEFFDSHRYLGQTTNHRKNLKA